MRAAARRAGLDPSLYNTHSLRHGKVRDGMSANVPRYVTQALGGWTNAASMDTYEHVTRADLRAASTHVAFAGSQRPSDSTRMWQQHVTMREKETLPRAAPPAPPVHVRRPAMTVRTAPRGVLTALGRGRGRLRVSPVTCRPSGLRPPLPPFDTRGAAHEALQNRRAPVAAPVAVAPVRRSRSTPPRSKHPKSARLGATP